MWMTHPSLPGEVVSVPDESFYGAWQALGWVSTTAPSPLAWDPAYQEVRRGDLQLSHLTDTAISSPVDGGILQWDAASGKWKNRPSPNATYAPITGSSAYHPLLGQRHGRAMLEKLRIGNDPVAVLALGDSTTGSVSGGSATTYFFYLALAAVAAKFPAYTTTYLTWEDSFQGYDIPVTVQTGTAGDRYFRPVNGTAFLTTPDTATTSVTGDLDVRLKATHDNWQAPASQASLASKMDGAGQRSWRLELATNGKLVFSNTADGTTLIDRTSTLAVPFANGTTGWVRAVLDVDNGATGNTVTFYTSTDGTTWNILGTPVVTAAVTSIFDSTAPTYFPGRTSGGYNPGGCNFHALHVLNGIAGTPVTLLDMDVLPASTSQTTLTDFTGNTWTINNPGTGNESRGGAPGFVLINGGAPGQAIAYSNDGTRFPKQTPYPADVCFINYSHNEGTNVAYRAAYKQLADAVIAKWPDCRIVATIQNQRLSPASNIVEHDTRAGQIASLAITADYGLIDVRAAFGANPATYIQADGVHPTLTGSPKSGGQAWADEVYNRLFAAGIALYGL